nr:alpha-glycosidase [Cohnella sp. GbtcB17]
MILREAVYHRPGLNYAYAADRRTLHLRLRAARGNLLQANIVAGDKYAWEQTVVSVPMRLYASDALFDYWTAAVAPPYRRLKYAFRLIDADEELYVTERGFETRLPAEPTLFFDFPYINHADVFAPPAWVRDAIFYQIFPERFANGDPSNDPPGVRPWGEVPTPSNFFGGDLKGVSDRLDHLTALGVNAIYFTPLFEATTNHKYDTRDYLKIDPHFGTNDDLKTLVKACHERGIRVLLDAVFNHAGRTFPPFVDVLERGAASPYADWFHVREFPLTVRDGIPTYETFAFEPIMPKLNTENPEVQAYLLEVARYWVEEIGIDGWRLDVADEVDHAFWRAFRNTVKTANPDTYILGEIWHDAILWLQGDQFDAVMNYPVSDAVLDFFARDRTDAAGFAAAIGAQLAAYPEPVTMSAFNLLDSHDTARLLTQCGGNEKRMRLAALFQLTYPGVPCIYYGDEIGMSGGGDPDCRRCMIWDEAGQNAGLFGFYRDTIALRKAHEALRSPHFAILEAKRGGSLLVYERRSDDGGRIVVAMNAGVLTAEVSVDVGGTAWEDAYTGTPVPIANGKLTAALPAYGYAVWRQTDG